MKVRINEEDYNLTALSKLWKDNYKEYLQDDTIILDTKNYNYDDAKIYEKVSIEEQYEKYNQLFNNIYNDVSQLFVDEEDQVIADEFLVLGQEIRSIDNSQMFFRKNEEISKAIKKLQEGIIKLLNFYNKIIDSEKESDKEQNFGK